MNTIVNLSEKQQEAVLHNNGALLVIASAGSGKTRVLTERIKLLIELTKRKILAITFTNKAGEEMKERLGDNEKVKTQVFIGTFHGFCKQILEDRFNLIGYNTMPHIFEDDSDRLELIEQAIAVTPSYSIKYKKFDAKKQRNFKYDVLEFISKVKRELLTEEELFEKTNDAETVFLYNSYQEILKGQNAIDFDDLIKLCYDIFINNPSVAALYRRSYDYICIDEAQDLNNAQYKLLKAITNSEHKNVMMVGDPNQSIFAFNGSSSQFMSKHFVNDFNPKIVELRENYRSSRKVIEAAEKIIPGSNNIVNMVIDGIFEIQSTKNEETEAQWIIDKIINLLSNKTHPDIEGDIMYEKIAILARNKYVFSKIERKLTELSMPYYYKVTPGSIKFESKIMNVFDLALKVKINPNDSLHNNRLSELLEINKNCSLTEKANLVEDDYLKQIINLVLNIDDEGKNLRLSLNKFSDFIKTNKDNSNENELNMVINDIEELQEHWKNYAKKTEKKSLSQFKNAMALGQTHPQSQPKGITLSTVHTMKGQEYDIVFLMGMDDETFPDYRAISKNGAELIQEKNNAYVAFTRARRFLFISYPMERLMPWGDTKRRKISRFLECFQK